MKILLAVPFLLCLAISASAQCSNGDVLTLNTSTKLQVCVAQSALPVSTAAQTALDLKLTSANLQYCFLAADQTVSSATLANMTGCSLSVTSGQKYFGRAVFFLSDSVAAEGVKLDFGGGSASATNFRAQAAGLDSALTIVMQVTGISSAISAAVFTGSGATAVDFTFEPSSTGTFIPRVAQASHSLGTLTLARGSFVQLTLVP